MITSTNISHECQAFQARPISKCKLCGSDISASYAEEISTNVWKIDHLLQLATKKVGEAYIQIPRIDQRIDQTEHYRERAYCYELYHQMRCLWPVHGHSDALINGELDKAGHQLFQEARIKGAKPDFLVHKPGRMDLNHTIIEVKTVRSDAEAQFYTNSWCCDLDTLDAFIKNAGYRFAIFLLVGDEQEEFIINHLAAALIKYPNYQKNKRAEEVEKLNRAPKEGRNRKPLGPEPVHPKSWCREIQIWHHAKANEPAKRIKTLGELLEEIGESWRA